MTPTLLCVLALCRFLCAMQPEKSEFSWAQEIELISDKLLHSKSPEMATNPQNGSEQLWLNFSLSLYYNSQIRSGFFNAMLLNDQLIYKTFLNMCPGRSWPFKTTSQLEMSIRTPLNDLLNLFNGRIVVYLKKLTPYLEDGDGIVDKDIIIALIELCELQYRATGWVRIQESPPPFVKDRWDDALPNIQTFVSIASQNLYMKSFYNLGVFGRYLFKFEKNNAIEAVQSGLYKESSPDVHLALILLARYSPKVIVGAKEQDYSPFSVETIIKIFPFAFQPIKGVYLNHKALYFLTSSITTAFHDMSNKSSFSKSEALCITACVSFVRVQLEQIAFVPTVGSLWVPVVEALAEATTLLLPSGAVPKFMPLPSCKSIKIKDLRELKAILFAAEKYNMKKELQTKMLARVIETFAMAVGILEMLIPKGVAKKTLEHPWLPFRVYLAAGKFAFLNRQTLYSDAIRHRTLIVDSAFQLGADARNNPMHPRALEFKKKYKLVYEALFQDQSCPSVQVSPEQRESILKELIDDDTIKQEPLQRPTNKRTASKRKRTKKNKGPKVEVNPDTGEIIKVVTEGPCTSLVVFSDADDEDGLVVPEEEFSDSISSGPSDGIISLHQEEVKTFKPDRVAILLDHNDWHLLLKWDARDLAYSYLIIGNWIFIRFLTPLLASLSVNYRNMRELFNTSIERFKMELLNLQLGKPELFKYILRQAKIEDVAMLCKCLEWYSKRLKITHQHMTHDGEFRREAALDYVSMLCTSAQNSDFSQGIADAFGFDTDRDLKIFEISLTRPSDFPSMDAISFDISILALYDLLARSDQGANYGDQELSALKALRNSIAHGYSSMDRVHSYISHIYGAHPDIKFLRSLLPSSPLLLKFRK